MNIKGLNRNTNIHCSDQYLSLQIAIVSLNKVSEYVFSDFRTFSFFETSWVYPRCAMVDILTFV